MTESRKTKPVFRKVGKTQNLYRHAKSGTYYSLIKRSGKQFRRSLKTTDLQLAKNRLADLHREVSRLKNTENAKLPFESIAMRWLQTKKNVNKPSSIVRRKSCIKNLASFLGGRAIKKIQPHHCEEWDAWRSPSMNKLKSAYKNQMKLQPTVGVGRVSSRFLHFRLFSVLIFSGFFAAQTFSETSISLDTAFVGDDGNTADTTGYGSVSYGYYIGKYEVTNSEYSAFLNAVADTDTYVLWHQSMSIKRTGSNGNYSYSVVEGQAKHPVLRVNFYNAARFANWLMNGQPTGSQDSSTTETGFYTFSDATTISSQGTRSASLIDGKNWVAIASEDEWYKAAYYDPTLNSGSGGYYQYPAGSDTAPTKSAPTSDLNSANYGGSNVVGSTTVVGSYSGAPSPYGTFDQGGNVQEWTDSIPEVSNRAVRGGWYNSSKGKAMLSTFRYPTDSTKKQTSIGFRVSSMATLSVEATLSADSRRYGIGDTLLIKAIWNNTVQVTGTPKLKLSNGSEAAYSSGNNTSTLVFFYEIQAGDVSANDISVEEYTGTIKNASGDPVRQISGDLGSVGTVSESGAGRGLGKMGPGDVAPDWGRVVIYPNLSATVLSEVSVGGKPVSGGSVVGAFVEEELRAEQEVVLANGRSYATLNVNLTGRERVTFRIREAASGKEYRVARVLELGLGETYGRAEELVKLNAVMAGSGVSILSYTHSPFGFSFDTGKDKSYTVEATGDLLKWNRVETFQGTGSAVQFTDTRKALFGKQYYRVKTLE